MSIVRISRFTITKENIQRLIGELSSFHCKTNRSLFMRHVFRKVFFYTKPRKKTQLNTVTS